MVKNKLHTPPTAAAAYTIDLSVVHVRVTSLCTHYRHRIEVEARVRDLLLLGMKEDTMSSAVETLQGSSQRKRKALLERSQIFLGWQKLLLRDKYCNDKDASCRLLL